MADAALEQKDTATKQENFSIHCSQGYTSWLASVGGSLVVTTYQVGKILFLGLNDEEKFTLFDRTFPRAMGVGFSENSEKFMLATKMQIYEFDNLLAANQRAGAFDKFYGPHKSWITGDLDIHDLEIGADGLPIFVNTRFNCISTVAEGHSFKPIWKPGFISKIAAEDRCHLNGMVMQGGKPKYVTAVSKSDVLNGWRDRRVDGGLLIDVETNEIVLEGLSMPHSPRIHEGKLWVLNSGRGEFGWVDLDNKEFNPITFCPGFARGLTFAGNYAIIGISEPREGKTFDGLHLQTALKEKDAKAWCGLQIVDLSTGDIVEWVRIEGLIRELFDVQFLSDVKNPAAIGLAGEEINRMVSIAPNQSSDFG